MPSWTKKLENHSEIEILTIETTICKNEIFVAGIYRPRNLSGTGCTTNLEFIISKVSNKYEKLILISKWLRVIQFWINFWICLNFSSLNCSDLGDSHKESSTQKIFSTERKKLLMLTRKTHFFKQKKRSLRPPERTDFLPKEKFLILTQKTIFHARRKIFLYFTEKIICFLEKNKFYKRK